jgi:hypothetical protein
MKKLSVNAAIEMARFDRASRIGYVVAIEPAEDES